MTTLFYKLFKIFGFMGLISLIGYGVYVCTILIWPTPHSSSLKKHDAIIVLTGEANRIEKGFALLLNNNAKQLLISGVLNKVSRDEIIKKNSKNLSNKQQSSLRDHCCIHLDYKADTTETNAIESQKWVERKQLSSVILVTSSPHMPRSYLQFSRALSDNVSITPYPVRTKRLLHLVIDPQFWFYAGREYIKFLGSWIRLETQA